MQCSDSDIARRAGNTCNGFPWYNGGYPLSKLDWRDNHGYKQCVDSTTHVDNTTHGNNTARGNNTTRDYCHKWMTLEERHREWEGAVCMCVQEGQEDGRTFCQRWHCDQIKVSKSYGPHAHGYDSKWISQFDGKWEDDWTWGGNGWMWPWRGPWGNLGYATWIQKTFPGLTNFPDGPWVAFPYQCVCEKFVGERVCGPDVEVEALDCECGRTRNGTCVAWSCTKSRQLARGHHPCPPALGRPQGGSQP